MSCWKMTQCTYKFNKRHVSQYFKNSSLNNCCYHQKGELRKPRAQIVGNDSSNKFAFTKGDTEMKSSAKHKEKIKSRCHKTRRHAKIGEKKNSLFNLWHQMKLNLVDISEKSIKYFQTVLNETNRLYFASNENLYQGLIRVSRIQDFSYFSRLDCIEVRLVSCSNRGFSNMLTKM